MEIASRWMVTRTRSASQQIHKIDDIHSALAAIQMDIPFKPLHRWMRMRRKQKRNYQTINLLNKYLQSEK